MVISQVFVQQTFCFKMYQKTTAVLLNTSNDIGVVVTNSKFQNFTAQGTLEISQNEWDTMKQSIISKSEQTGLNIPKDETYSYFETINGLKIAGYSFKIKKQNTQKFIILIIQSQNEFDQLYETIIDRVQEKYIKPNISYMIVFFVLYLIYVFYSLFIARLITQPYRDIKQISEEIMKNQKVSNQLGSIIAYFNTLNFKHDPNLHNLVKSAQIMVQKIQKVSYKKIIENQKYSNAVHAEINQFYNTKMEWRESLSQLSDNEPSFDGNQSETISEFQYSSNTSIQQLITPFKIFNNKYDSHHKLQQKQIVQDCPKLSLQSTDMEDIHFMDHIQQYLPNLPIPS